jgi:hypothetical protein
LEAPDVLDESHHPERITTKSDADNMCNRGLFQQRCRIPDITSVCSRPHEHEHNGSFEETFRDIGDLAHTMNTTSAFTSTSLTHDHRHATRLKNRLPTERLNGDTPHYHMFNENYDMSNMRMPRGRAFAHIPSAQRAKLRPRATGELFYNKSARDHQNTPPQYHNEPHHRGHMDRRH